MTVKVFNCVIFIPTLTAGGAEKVASTVANHWASTKKVYLITFFDEQHFFWTDSRITTLSLGFKSKRGFIGRTFDIALAAWRLRQIVRSLEPYFLLSFMNKYNSFCLLALRGLRTPVIVSERSSPTEALPRIRVLARDQLYPWAAGLICQTRAGYDFISTQTTVQFKTIIPNPVCRIIEPKSRVPGKVILAVGRLVEAKGFDQLLVAIAHMKDDSWRLLLCGDGPLRAALEQQALALGIVDRVEFLGLVDDLAPYYCRTGIFAFSSLHEGFPNALAEALVSGLPCVSYNCLTGPSDLIVNGENGLLIPVGDISAMTAALDQLATDKNFAEHLGANAADLAKQLDPVQVSNMYLSFCESAAQRVICA